MSTAPVCPRHLFVHHTNPTLSEAVALVSANEVLREQGIAVSPEFRDVHDFHTKFNLLRTATLTPQHLTRGKLKERVEFLLEELEEFAEAAGLQIVPGDDQLRVVGRKDDQDLEGQADALVDLVYVALGTAVMLGLPWDALWADVQRANMAKVPGITKRRHAVDVTKPPGWSPPRTAAILNLAGYARWRFVGGATDSWNEYLKPVSDYLCVDDTPRAPEAV